MIGFLVRLVAMLSIARAALTSNLSLGQLVSVYYFSTILRGFMLIGMVLSRSDCLD